MGGRGRRRAREEESKGGGEDGRWEVLTSFVGAVVAGIAVGIVEEEGAEEGWYAED